MLLKLLGLMKAKLMVAGHCLPVGVILQRTLGHKKAGMKIQS